MSSKAFCESVLQHLNQIAPVTARAMFGGYGLYTNGTIFALIANDTLYFKVNDSNRESFVAAGMQPFTYDGKGKPIQMSYYQLPDAVWHDAEQLLSWLEKSAAIARKSKKQGKRQRN